MATRKQWFNDIQQQLNTDLTLKGLIEYHEENGEHFIHRLIVVCM